ncbi:hypothetical protein Poli38472_008520 [Pythium oligandrum]|uniref:HTH psq-type domain-containing protein n=1 Tax=Pythium oligandrum TaxID=41045 RepID=A0A8K1C4A7_PYTOL|nr:hypothetical protein Poli38472_008520 [Pythium oligandrum]|eukprot:TMW55872.1 hypothetical protein Poli38472_008520 [Pythium oligandrum]
MARGKADKQLTVGKKLEIIEEADRTGMIAATAQKYGVKTGQIRDWKKNIDRLRATDPTRLVAASTVQRGHLVFNETYAQYWVGYNKFCSANTNYDDLKHGMHITHKDAMRDGINVFGFPSTIDPTATHELECPSCSGFYTNDELKDVYQKDMSSLRDQLREFFEQKPFPTKYMYFVTKFDFYRPDPNAQNEDGTTDTDKATEPINKDSIDNYITVYVAICGNGSVMVPMTIFPPVEPWHWERKKPVKLRHAHSMHRTKVNDPTEALQFFSVTWKKFYDEEAKYSDKFAFLLDASVDEFRAPEFTEGLKQLDGYGKYWTSFYTVRNPLRHSNFEDVLTNFVLEEWRRILTLKKSSQPNDYRKCIAFWFYTAWEFFAGENARAAFRSCNMYLEDKATWGIDHVTDDDVVDAAQTVMPANPEPITVDEAAVMEVSEEVAAPPAEVETRDV